MGEYDYWRKQGRNGLFSEIDTLPPEQKRFAGKLLIIGGNKGVFFAVSQAMMAAQKIGVGEVRAVMPRSLRDVVPAAPGIVFVEAEASGAFGKESRSEILQEIAWADAVILIGDVGRNAETAVLFSEIFEDCSKPAYFMRDGLDSVMANMEQIALNEADVTVFASMAQLQKMLRAMYYPKMIGLSMPMNQLVETLHKFTLSYEMTIVTVHNGMAVIAENGQVITEELSDTGWSQLTIWGGEVLVFGAALKLWNTAQSRLKCLATALNFE